MFIYLVGSGLRNLGHEIGDKVGIMAKNCVEWEIMDYSCACLGLISVPVEI
jgi:long-subunit acyl-CoA synthetase (AMP-forming)